MRKDPTPLPPTPLSPDPQTSGSTSSSRLNFDLFWLKDDSLPEPDVLAAEITENLEAALESFAEVAEEVEATPVATKPRAVTSGPSAAK